MAQAMTQEDRARDIAAAMCDDVTHVNSSDDGWHKFHYDDLIQAHRLPDGWEFVGINDGWFTIRPA